MDKRRFVLRNLLNKDKSAHRLILDTCREGEMLGTIHGALIGAGIKKGYSWVQKETDKLVKFGLLNAEPPKGWNRRYFLTKEGQRILLSYPITKNPVMDQLNELLGKPK